jgi:magnesium transporter
MAEYASPGRVRAALRRGEKVDVRPEVFVQLEPSEQAAVLDRASSAQIILLLREGDSRSVVDGLTMFGIERAIPYLRELAPEDLADLALHLKSDYRERLMEALDPPLAAEVSTILSYPPDTAGGMMTPRYASIPDVVPVARALELLREQARAEAINYVYVVDANGRLAGTLPLRALLAAEPGARVQDVAARDIVKLRARQPKEEVVHAFKGHHYQALPVVDEQDRLVGVVTAESVVTAVRHQEDDILFGATGADAREPELRTEVAASRRLPWITMTVLGGLVCAFIAGLFKHTLERTVMLGLFVPLVLAVSESVAAQTATIVLKVLVTGDIPKGALLRFLLKEVAVGLLIGLYAAVLVVLASMLWPDSDFRLGIVIGCSVVLGVCWSTLVGVAVPTILRRFRVEPSVAGGPVVLMIADVFTLLFYFAIASIVVVAPVTGG